MGNIADPASVNNRRLLTCHQKGVELGIISDGDDHSPPEAHSYKRFWSP